ncbi:hypothetical protein BLNAU_10194 [Blattamonas nauphoetae]|uniref:RRM domain-containing protein n=1 Tax=Blattamonas nauphoetae TaxID=2049346 RepID=A0ABQ9XTR3_9EUKA|nr:hypothetical protein BLNAU_10194 [Blattamonas nauphoetae]
MSSLSSSKKTVVLKNLPFDDSILEIVNLLSAVRMKHIVINTDTFSGSTATALVEVESDSIAASLQSLDGTLTLRGRTINISMSTPLLTLSPLAVPHLITSSTLQPPLYREASLLTDPGNIYASEITEITPETITIACRAAAFFIPHHECIWGADSDFDQQIEEMSKFFETILDSRNPPLRNTLIYRVMPDSIFERIFGLLHSGNDALIVPPQTRQKYINPFLFG